MQSGYAIVFVISGITEIVAARVVEMLQGLGASDANIIIVPLRGYELSVLREVYLGNHKSAMISFDLAQAAINWKVPLFLRNSNNIKGSSFVRFAVNVENILKSYDISSYDLYAPHYNLSVSYALSLNRKCQSLNVIEEGDLSYVRKYVFPVPFVHRYPAFAYFKTLVTFILEALCLLMARPCKESSVLQGLTLLRRIQASSPLNFSASWFYPSSLLEGKLYGVFPYSFCFSDRLALLPSLSKFEADFMAANSDIGDDKLALVVLPHGFHGQTYSNGSISKIVTFLGKYYPRHDIVFRVHPDDLGCIQSLDSVFKDLSPRVCSPQRRERINKIPLELLVRINNNDLVVLGDKSSSFVRYLLESIASSVVVHLL